MGFLNSDASNHAVLARAERLVPLRDGAQPFHREILHGQQERTQVASGDFYVVRGEREPQDFGFVAAVERCGNEMLIGKNLCCAIGRFDPQAGRRSFTLPARWP